MSLCGEIASDPVYTALLLGLGFRRFSVSPGRLLEIKHAIRSIQLSAAEKLAAEVLSLSSARDIRARVQDEWSRRRPVSSPDLSAATLHPTALLPVTHNLSLRRFESKADDAPPAFLSYSVEGDRVVFEHTFVPHELRGHGLAATLARSALEEARRRRWRIVPHCSYVAGFIRRNPEFADLLDRREQK